MLNNSTHFAISEMMWFKKVRGGSMHLNYTELVQNHPAHLASVTQITDEEIRKHFPGCAITGTTREVYIRAIKKVSKFKRKQTQE